MATEDIVEYLILKQVTGTIPKPQLTELVNATLRAIPEMAITAPVRTPIGTFRMVARKERVLRNKMTGGQEVTIPAKRVLKFKQKG